MICRFFLFFVIFVSPVLVFSQDTSLVREIRQEAFERSAIPDLAYHLTDVCGPRLTNSPGFRKAVGWAVQQFKSWGIQAAPEAWGEYGKGWSNEATSLVMKEPYIESVTSYAVPWTDNTHGTVTAGVVLLDAFDSASIDKAGVSLQGKIVMVRKTSTLIPPLMEGDAYRFADSDLVKVQDRFMLPPQAVIGLKARLQSLFATKRYLAMKGAIALLNGKGRDGTVFNSTFLGYSKQVDVTLPEMVITSEAYLKLQRFLEHGEHVSLQMNVQNTLYTDDLTGYNVIAEIPGSDPVLKKEVVMIGAHLDSWTSATGATDNGAGCVVMMEAFRILKVLGIQPKRTIRLALWGGEEEVILGSYG